MVVLDGHESHRLAKFETFCKYNNVITINLPAHSSHLTQRLNVRCLSALMEVYDQQIEYFVKLHINHITKVKFFLAFEAAHYAAMTKSNVKGGLEVQV